MLTLHTGLGRFLYKYKGEEKEWQYDVVTLKLTFEELERLHGLRIPKTDEVKPPTSEFLQALAEVLSTQFGLPAATPTIAFKIYNVVNVQFCKIVVDIDNQVNAILQE